MIEFDEQKNRPQESYGWYEGRWGDKIKWSAGGSWFLPYVKYVNLEALAETKYKYCAYDRYRGEMSLMAYCRLFRKHKEVELMAKSYLHQFIDVKFLDCMANDHGLKRFFRANVHDVFKYSIRDVIVAYKKGITLDAAKVINFARYSLRGAPNGIDKIELARYLSKNNIDPYDYYHYAETVAKAKEDIFAFGNTFPKDFHRREKEMQRKVAIAQAQEDRERERQLKAVAARVNKILDLMKKRLAFRVGDYSVIVPTTRKEFVAEGNAMRNCIGGYFNSCADGRMLCFFVRKNGKRLADVEADPKSGAIRQCRLKCNKEADAETKEFAAMFAKRLAKDLQKKRKAA